MPTSEPRCGAACATGWAIRAAPDIPDDDVLHSHICAPGYKLNSNDQTVLEPKDKIRKRLQLSPDGGDALALTFAEPVRREPRQRQRVADHDYPILG